MPTDRVPIGTGTAAYLPNVDRIDRPSTVNANLPSTYATLSIYNRPGFKSDLYGITSAGASNASLIAAALRRAQEERARLEMLRKQREEALRNAQALRQDEPMAAPQGAGYSSFERFRMLQQAAQQGAEGTFYKNPEAQFDPTRRVTVGGVTLPMAAEQSPAWMRSRWGQPESVDLNPADDNEPYTIAPFYPEGTDDTTGLPVPGTRLNAEGQPWVDSNYMPFVPQTLEERKQRLEEFYQAFPELEDQKGDLSLSSIPDVDAIARSARDRAISQADFAKGTLAAYNNRDIAAEYRRKQIEIWGEPRQIFYDDPSNVVSKVNPKSGVTEYFDRKTGKKLDRATSTTFVREEFGYQDPSGTSTEGPTGKNVEYLGLNPGEVPIRPVPDPPPLDAPYSEWVKYRKMLDNVFQTPLYKPEDPYRELAFMDAKKRAQFQRGLVEAGLYDADHVYTPGIITPVEIELMTAIMGNANLNGTTWQDIMEVEKAEGRRRAAESYGGGYGGGGGGGTNIYTQIQYTQTSIAQARSLLVNVLKEALGRAPTDSELQRFLVLLNKAESKSPTKTVTKTTTEGDRTRAVSRMTPSTVDAEALAEEFAQGIGGGAEFRGKSDYDYLSGLFASLGDMNV